MIRLLLVLSLGLFSSASLAQHTIEGFPNPYDEEADDYLVLRNTGSEPVLLDSLSFADVLNEIPDGGSSREFSYEAFLGGEELTGYVTCYYSIWEPWTNDVLCREGWDQVDVPVFFDQYLAATDSIRLFNFGSGCPICNMAPSTTFDDTLLVFADSIEAPLEVEILNGRYLESGDSTPQLGAHLSIYPNPSSGGVAVFLTLETPAHATVSIRDIRGRTVATLVDGVLSSGEHTFLWDHSGVAPGVYVVQAYTGEAVLSKNVTVVR